MADKKKRDSTLANHVVRKYRIGTKVAEFIGTTRQNAGQQLRNGTPKIERATEYRDAIKQFIGLEFDVTVLFARFKFDEAERIIAEAAMKKHENPSAETESGSEETETASPNE